MHFKTKTAIAKRDRALSATSPGDVLEWSNHHGTVFRATHLKNFVFVVTRNDEFVGYYELERPAK